MQLAQLSETVLKKLNNSESIKISDWPERIELPDDVKKTIKNLAKYTDPRNSKKETPSGWEYEQSVFYFNGEIFLSESVAGNYERVKPAHSFKAQPEYSKDNTKLNFIINVDKRRYKSKQYGINELSNKKLTYGFIISLHTHPKRIVDNKAIYSFFSVADISCLVYGRIPIIGVIWGNSIWLVCKTSDSQIPSSQILNQASILEYQSGINGVIDFIKTDLDNYGLVFYQSTLGNILKRV